MHETSRIVAVHAVGLERPQAKDRPIIGIVHVMISVRQGFGIRGKHFCVDNVLCIAAWPSGYGGIAKHEGELV